VKEWLSFELPETRSGNIPGAVVSTTVAFAFWFVTTRITESAWDYIPGVASYFTAWVALGYHLRAVFGPNSFTGD
jgi:hypothetical protein